MNSNVTPFFLLALAIALFYVYINPEYSKIDALRAQEAQYSDALDRVQEISQIRDQLLTKYNSFSPDDLNKLQTMLPDTVDNVHLVLDMANVAGNYGLSLSNIKVDRPQQDLGSSDETGQVPQYQTVNVAFDTSGTLANYTSFLKDIESSLRITDVTGISIRPLDSGKYQFTTVVNTYWLK
jgi:hypothetical protein